ncbi:M56 family metallopeptidase [Kitasatospora sp. RB6PN24]|uniref:M56 family metallopeptidase n=1 Tax=Kitasatospora humi TaxID=2893891 RepID=UPI001E39FF0A|nr:M56 family metallopeptidase [Kitasatospora humi]MCC9311580.1 M56 family metallopeptidase [Kitasatospora humi]
MYVTVYLLLLAPGLLAALGPALTRHLAPAAAVRALTALAILASASTAWGLAVLAIGGLARTGEVQAYAKSDPAALAAADPVPRTLGALAAALLVIALVRFTRAAWRRQRDVRALTPLRDLPAAGDLIVLDTENPDAYALPGRAGRIVVTSGMLRALPHDECQVMLAHERAHLRHRHDLYAAATVLAAAFNPLLGRVRESAALQIERWADEDAAAQAGSRHLAARSLARAALATTGRAGGLRGSLAYLRHQVTARVAALQAASPASCWSAAWPALVLVLLTTLALADTTGALGRFLEVLHP